MQFLKAHYLKLICLSIVAVLGIFFAVNYNKIQASRQKLKAQGDAERRQHCREHFCEGDVVPPFYQGNRDYSVFKAGGQFFALPSQYGGVTGAFGFFWFNKKAYPSSKPPEELRWADGKGWDTANLIELFAFGYREGEGSKQYQEIDPARVSERKMVRDGLEEIILKPSEGGYISRYFIATKFKQPYFRDRLPRLYCDDLSSEQNACTTGIPFTETTFIYVRFSVKYGYDWPEIYQEIENILKQIKEIK